ncbi:DUF87 domain-containing protein [TM7 phylum sp. oral taxon 351]|nr:DUF87 domain-containing protein [TM7 phylum sp. oral taxon 351]
MLRRDRSRHVYVIGQTGAGKSGLLELFALSDTFYNQGYCIIDPHGDFAIDNLRFVPENRIDDVVYFNPADTQYPVAFNPLELSDPSRKPNVCSEVIGVLKRMFGDSWGPRLEHILRYTLLALLDRPETTLLDISRLLTDKDFRKETLDYCTDVTVLQFWKQEFGQWNDKQVNESIAPVLNKVGAFTANPIIRNIIGQPRSSFNVRKIMDEGKILVVNLSKGLIGEDNAGILGAFLVTKIQLAAMSRSDIPDISQRRPFYLYVDEFQNFATDSFAVILSEARKYGLNLTVANQYIAQMTESVRDAVFGNVGTTISFRVSADDAPLLSKQFEPTFEAQDLLQMNNRHFVISMIINGEKAPAFSATTLNIPKTPQDNFDSIVRSSREKYSRNRAEVEAEIRQTIEQSEKYKKNLSDSGRQPVDEKKGTNWGSNYGNGYINRNYAAGPKPSFITPAEPIKTSALNATTSVNSPKNSAKSVIINSPEALKKAKISPNFASNEQRSNDLKNLKQLINASEKSNAPEKSIKAAAGNEKGKETTKKTEVKTPATPNSLQKFPKNFPKKDEKRSRQHKNKRNRSNLNASTRPQDPLESASSSHPVNFASDLHDGRPGVSTSQTVAPGAHQESLRQNLREHKASDTDSGFLSIHH